MLLAFVTSPRPQEAFSEVYCPKLERISEGGSVCGAKQAQQNHTCNRRCRATKPKSWSNKLLCWRNLVDQLLWVKEPKRQTRPNKNVYAAQKTFETKETWLLFSFLLCLCWVGLKGARFCSGLLWGNYRGDTKTCVVLQLATVICVLWTIVTCN